MRWYYDETRLIMFLPFLILNNDDNSRINQYLDRHPPYGACSVGHFGLEFNN